MGRTRCQQFRGRFTIAGSASPPSPPSSPRRRRRRRTCGSGGFCQDIPFTQHLGRDGIGTGGMESWRPGSVFAEPATCQAKSASESWQAGIISQLRPLTSPRCLRPFPVPLATVHPMRDDVEGEPAGPWAGSAAADCRRSYPLPGGHVRRFSSWANKPDSSPAMPH
jgi:hypothetical protein